MKPLSEEAFIKVGHGRKKALFYVVDLILVFFITVLYYAVMNWISTLLVEIHHLSQDISIYITILAPALISLGPVMTIRSCDRDRDFVKVGMKYMLAVLPIPLLLSFLYNVNVIVAFVLSVVFVIVVNGVKAIVLSIIAFKLREEVNTAEYCVISNATASLAGGIAPTVVGSIIDSHGWSVSYLVIFAISLFVFVSIAVTDAVVVRAKKKNEKVNLEN
jgi:sugar phosphate permease